MLSKIKSMLGMLNNSVEDYTYFSKDGSRHFACNCYINGEYFRSKTNNQYFSVVKKDVKLDNIHNAIYDFRELEKAIELRKYNPETDNIVRLEFSKNKKYFVESYQAIFTDNPDITIINMSLEDIREITPSFEPLPDHLS